MVDGVPLPEGSLEENDDHIENGKLACGPYPNSLAASFSAVVEEESELEPSNGSFVEGRSGLFDIMDDEDVDMVGLHRDGTQEPKSKRRHSKSSISASFKSISVEGIEAETTVSEGFSITVNTPFKTVRQVRPREHSFGGASAGEVGTSISFESHFQSLGRLGSGAFADVFKVRCNIDGNLYAVKRNRRQFRGKRDRERAMAEVRMMQRLQSSAGQGQVVNDGTFEMFILLFIRAWQEDGHLFSQTELCSRHTCRQLLLSLTSNWDQACKVYPSLIKNMVLLDKCNQGASGKLVPERTVWKICHDVAAGLCHIHSHGIVHHDIKPQNIFFVLHPQLGALCKIGDFGMAGDIGTVEDGQEGDTVYMPQELFNYPTKDPSGDIFSFGLSLYEVASTGTWTLPTEGARWHEIRSGTHEPELPSSRSKELVCLIQKMINPLKEKRPTAYDILSSSDMVATMSKVSDKFLTEYINDVDNYDQAREREAVIAQNESNQR
jgi:serine/threonine protein kinase